MTSSISPNRPPDSTASPDPGSPKEAEGDACVQAKLLAIWKSVLKLEDIGIHDNYFELGGESQKGMILLARVTEELGVKLPFTTLFSSSTVALMTQAVQEQRRADLEEASSACVSDLEAGLL